MKRNIKAEDYQAVLELMREERPGRVYILYRRKGTEYRCEDYDRWGLYFSLERALEDCTCMEGEGCVSYRLELNDPEPDGSARYVGMFFLWQYPGKDPVVYDAALGYEPMKELLGREPKYVDLTEAQSTPEFEALEKEIAAELKGYLPFEIFTYPVSNLKFVPEDFCSLLEKINRYFLALNQTVPARALTIIEGLTQIASCSAGHGIQFQAAKAAAGVLLHNLKSGTLEPSRLVFPAMQEDPSGELETCRQVLVLDFQKSDLRPFCKFMRMFAGDLIELELGDGGVTYEFFPFAY